MSSRLGEAWRRYAASARAAWSMTTSARWPSTSASTQIDEMSRAWAALTRMSFTRAIASASARARFWSAAANSFMKSCSPRLKAASRSAISTRWSGSRMPSTSTHSPKRSSSCGRSSPSSGFIVPTRMKCDGWLNDTPSRSMVLTPIAAASRRTSTRWSSRRFTSSTYRMLRFASASTPGSKRRVPVRRAASMSIVPTTRSSEALIGSSTTRIRRLFCGSVPASRTRVRQSAHNASRSLGSQPKWQPSTTSCSGSSLASPRTAVDLPVPFSPRMSTPPMVGTIAFRIRASFIESWPTIAVNGKECRSRVSTDPSLGLGRDQLLHHVALLEQLLRRLLDPLPGVVIVLEVRDDLPVLAVRPDGKAELQAIGHVVFPVARHRQRVPVAPGRRGADADDRVDHGVGGRRCRRCAPRLDHRGAALLDDLDELAFQPAVIVDDLEHGQAGDAGVVRVRVLSRGMVAPDRHVRDGRHGSLGLLGQLRASAILVQARHGKPAVVWDLWRVEPRAVAVRVARLAHDEDPHLGGRVLGDWLALRPEDPSVDCEQVAPLHALLPRHRADEQGPAGALERDLGLARQLHAGEHRKRAVLQLHGDALERLHGRLDLQHAQHDRLFGAEHLARRNAEDQRVADLAGRAGHRDLDGHSPAHLRAILVRVNLR